MTKDGMKILKVSQRWGNFNFCDASQKSYSVSFTLTDENEKKSINVNMENPPFEMDDGFVDAEQAIDFLEQWIKGIWISTQKDEVVKFRNTLVEHSEKIEVGNSHAMLDELRKKRDSINKSIENLEKKIIDTQSE